MTDTAGVFVSYASADRDRIEPVVKALEECGVQCWFDVRDLQPFDSKLTARIADGIADTAVTLAFLSDAYQASEACRWELLRTLQTNGQQDLLLVALGPSPVMWSAVTENVFFDLTQGTLHAAALLAEKIAGHVHGRPPRGAPSEYAWWWPQEWAGSGFEGRFDERLKLISLLTPHIGKHNDHRASRQVQIVGLGGQGKTMLALQSARDLAWYYPGGCAIPSAAPVIWYSPESAGSRPGASVHR